MCGYGNGTNTVENETDDNSNDNILHGDKLEKSIMIILIFLYAIVNHSLLSMVSKFTLSKPPGKRLVKISNSVSKYLHLGL